MNSRLREIERLHVGLLAAAAGAAYLLSGSLATSSILLGGAVMLINFRLLSALVARLLSPTAAAKPGIVVALMLAKLGFFIAAIAFVVWNVPIDVLAFALGATSLLIAITLSSLRPPTPAHP